MGIDGTIPCAIETAADDRGLIVRALYEDDSRTADAIGRIEARLRFLADIVGQGIGDGPSLTTEPQ